jgi:hypothetical protein
MNKQDKKSLVSSGIDETSVRIQPRFSYNYSNDLRFEAFYRLYRIRDNDEKIWSTQNLYYFNVTWQYPIPR